jgi:hypothetical protein
MDDLLADPPAMKVRYLTIDLDKDVVLGQADRNVRVRLAPPIRPRLCGVQAARGFAVWAWARPTTARSPTS